MGEMLDDFYFDRDECCDIERQEKTCNRCGAVALHWWDFPGIGWRLVDSEGKIHRCDRQAVARQEFDPV